MINFLQYIIPIVDLFTFPRSEMTLCGTQAAKTRVLTI